MKYSLTLHDLSAAQVTDIVNRVKNETIITGNFTPAVVTEAANQNAMAAGATANDIDSIISASTNQLLQAGKTGELDSAGLPWDERIHSGSKKKNVDGKWKLRKNVDDALVKSVEAENRGAAPTGEIPAFLQNQPAPVAPVIAPAIVPATLVANATPPAPVAPPAPTAPLAVQPQAPIARDFSGLMLQISKLFASKQITPDYPNTIVQRINAGFGVQIVTLTDIANDPRMVEYAWQCLEVDGKAA